jgi:large subunit ribosomal protein L29
MKIDELRTLDDKGLLLHRQDLVGELASLRFNHATGQLDNTSRLKTLRRELARVNTLIRMREADAGLHKGGLVAKIGKLDGGQSAFAAFRDRLSAAVENG